MESDYKFSDFYNINLMMFETSKLSATHLRHEINKDKLKVLPKVS